MKPNLIRIEPANDCGSVDVLLGGKKRTICKQRKNAGKNSRENGKKVSSKQWQGVRLLSVNLFLLSRCRPSYVQMNPNQNEHVKRNATKLIITIFTKLFAIHL